MSNWYSLLALYINVLSKTQVKFKNGREIIVSKANFNVFYEELYKLHLQNHGFSYKTQRITTIQTPDGLQLMLLKIPYSFVIDEIFLMKVYGEPNLEGRTVIDIGASIGDSALYFVKRGASKVYGFELDTEYSSMARENIVLNKMIDKIKIYNEKATSKSLKSLILQYKLRNVFLKIDCEGCEYEVVENTDNHTFESINDVVIEYHREFEPLVRRLAMLGFKVKRKREILFGTKNQIVP
ncbi:MAG: FkbM family methyltransferase [Nitrososphaeraceae archaeon]|nr:FkbM family methyltransferase [Nitrososphaeraceae archaeon]